MTPSVMPAPGQGPAISHVLSYQLDLLKLELGTINGIIERIDGITQATKNWSVVTWAGGVGLALSQPALRRFVVLTAILPMLFWFIDAVWRRLQARSIYRMRKIREFVNNDGLARSFEMGRLHGFVVLDPTGTQYKDAPDYEAFVSLRRTLEYREVATFYAVPVLVSILLQLLFVRLR